MGAELVSALAGRGVRGTAPVMTFQSLSPGSCLTPGYGLIPVVGPPLRRGEGTFPSALSCLLPGIRAEIEMLCKQKPRACKGCAAGATKLIHRLWWQEATEQQTIWWSWVGGGAGLRAHPQTPRICHPRVPMTYPRDLHVPALWSLFGSEPVPRAPAVVLLWGAGLWVGGCRENPTAWLFHHPVGAALEAQLCQRGHGHFTGLSLCSCVLQVLCHHAVPKHPPHHLAKLQTSQRPAWFLPIPTPTLPFLLDPICFSQSSSP